MSNLSFPDLKFVMTYISSEFSFQIRTDRMYFGEGFPTILSINLVVEIFCIGHNKIIFETMPIKMLSDVGKTYDRSRTIRPMDKNQRERVYASCQIKAQTKIGQKKFSPFNTISRSSRDSYLLRVTKQPNTKTNYQLNFNKTLPTDRRATIDQASFERIIGPVNDKVYNKELNEKGDHRCVNAFKKQHKVIPLTVRETHKWRKTFEHLDFRKQPETGRQIIEENLKTMMKETRDSQMMKTLQQTTESNFNNYRRFSLKSKKQKSHSFNSDAGHEYLKRIENREIEPQYDVTQCRQETTRKSMRTPRGQMRFYKNKQKIVTRFDRSDPQWLQMLDYNPEDLTTLQKDRAVNMDLTVDRKPNYVHSQYSMRLSLQPPAPMNKQ